MTLIPLQEWMSKPVITVKPEDTVFKAVQKMVKYGIGDVVVVDKKKFPLGILTERDILKRVIAKNKDPKKLKVEDVMTKKIKTVPLQATILEVSRLMKKGKFRRVPVVDKGKVVGIITARDLVHFMSL